MDKRTKEQLSEFLANELHSNHLNGTWFDAEDVMDVMDDFFKKKKLFDKRDQLEEELKRVTRQIESGDSENSENSENSDEEEKMCEYCSGEPMHGRKPLMTNQDESYTVFINSCNYLEDSVVGNSVPHSLFGVKINFCPVCGKELKEN